MIGSYSVRVSTSRLIYTFTINRNITIIKGDSATGKTTLVELIREHYEAGEKSGVEIQSKVPCRTLGGRDWSVILPTISGSIVFIDEDNDFLTTDEFATSIKETDNYYVIVTREGLPNLPYSVDEIYGIHESGKYTELKKVYNEFYKIYSKNDISKVDKLDEIIVEDSNSGFQFFEGIAKDNNVSVISAFGKSNIYKTIVDESGIRLVVADGAAFGSEMDRISKLINIDKDIILYLPESFEWLILKSGVIDGNRIKEIIAHPEDYIDSKEYFSWEQYFTSLLIRETEGTYLKYTKSKLNDVYLHEREKEKILDAMERVGKQFR